MQQVTANQPIRIPFGTPLPGLRPGVVYVATVDGLKREPEIDDHEWECERCGERTFYCLCIYETDDA